MKTLKLFLPLVLMLTLVNVSCSKDDDEVVVPTNNESILLSANEKADLIQMREEEKLARDVYLFSLDLYGMQIFSNISNSEQRHMDKLLELLVKYNVQDPASTERGVFNDSELQALYNSLTAKSELSLLDALIVGATIEDLDIYDLNVSIKNTNKADIIEVYEKLNCGSRNHMRAFSGQITNEGGSYSAQYISEQEYQDILSSDHENCGH